MPRTATSTTASPLHPANPGPNARSVCVIVPKDLRGFVLSLGAIEAIAASYPRANIVVAADGTPNALVEACPFVDRSNSLHEIDFKKAKFDIVYDLASPAVSKQAYRNRPRHTVWCGPQQDAAIALSSSAPGGRLARLAHQLDVAGVAYTGDLPLPDFGWIGPHFDHAPRLQPAFFGLNGPFAFIALDGEPAPPAPSAWGTENYLKLTQYVANTGLIPALVGEAKDGPLAQAIITEERRAINLVNRAETAQIATLAQSATYAVGANSAALAIAALQGRPGIVLQVASKGTLHEEAPVGAPHIQFYAERLTDLSATRVCQFLEAFTLTNP